MIFVASIREYYLSFTDLTRCAKAGCDIPQVISFAVGKLVIDRRAGDRIRPYLNVGMCHGKLLGLHLAGSEPSLLIFAG